MELHEYAQYDATGLRELMRAGEVNAAEVEAVARHALDVANAELNGLASRCSHRRSTTPPTGRSQECPS